MMKGQKGRVENGKANKKRLSQETKDYIVKMILEDGIKIREMAQKFEIGESTIQRWLKAVRDEKKQEALAQNLLPQKNMKKCKPNMKKSCVR